MKFLPRQPDIPRANLTPLIDVVFLLLIFLMVSTSFVDRSELDIQLPGSANSVMPQAADVSVTITRQGAFFINGEAVDAGMLEARIQAEAIRIGDAREGLVNSSALLSADGQTAHANVVTVMDALSRAGFGHVAIATLYNGAEKQ